jgi:hypothetical protein
VPAHEPRNLAVRTWRTLQKLWRHAKAVRRTFAIAKARDISPSSFFFADADSVFGNREDQDKYKTFLLLSQVPVLAPHLVYTTLVSSLMSDGNGQSIGFPLVVKPIWGAQSGGVAGIRDEDALRRFLPKGHSRYIAQPLISDALEIAVSFTRNPEGSPDFFGVGVKQYLVSARKWKGGIRHVSKHFVVRDITNNVDRERFLDLCRAIAATLRTNTFRFDAFVRDDGECASFDTLRIIDVNTGVFAADEFLFDTRLTSEFVVGELTRRYAYLLSWGERKNPRPTRSQRQELLLHYLYCCSVTLYRHFMDHLAKAPRYLTRPDDTT